MPERLITLGYNLLLPAGAIIYSLKRKKAPSFLKEESINKFLSFKKTPNRPLIWLHAVSVGETLAAYGFIKHLKKKWPNAELILTTTTETGYETANKKLKEYCNLITYFPLDFLPLVKLFISKIKPDIICIMETEIWPTVLTVAQRQNIPIFMINGRISDKSFIGYMTISNIIKKYISKYTLMFMKSQEDRLRIIAIGADPQKVKATGNIKYFSVSEQAKGIDVNSVKNTFKKKEEKLIVFGSTHEGEDTLAIELYLKLKKEIDRLKVIIAPRHPERAESIVKLISEKGIKPALRSKNESLEDSDILILDTVGELMKVYSICDLAVVCGSFKPIGGHNPLEPLAFGKPVIMGPYINNFRDIVQDMKTGIEIVENEEKLVIKAKAILKQEITLDTRSCMEKIESSEKGIEEIVQDIRSYARN